MYYQRPLFIRIIESFCRYWRIFVATSLTIILLLTAYIVTRPKNYITQYTVVLNTQTLVNPESGQSEVIDWNAVNQNVNHFQTLVQTKDFIQDSLAPLDDPSTPGDHLNRRIDFNNDGMVSSLQKGISVGPEGTDAFNVSLVWNEPEDSEIILKHLIDKFMQETAEQKSAAFTQQVAFDKKQLDDFSTQAEEASAKLTAFNTIHEGHLPEQQGGIIQDLANEKQHLADAQITLASDQSREALLSQQLNGIPKEILSNQTIGTSPLQMEIQQLHLALDQDIAAGKKPNHPDVLDKERRLDILNRKLAQLNGKGEANNVSGEEKEPNPSYTTAKWDLDNLEINLVGEKTRISQLAAQINNQVAGVSKLPEETREYTNLLTQYQFYTDQLQKAQNALQDAKDQEEISLENQTSNYTPLLTMEPEPSTSKSKTAILFAGGLLLALLVSAGLVVLAEAADRSFRDAYDLQRTLGVPVLAMLPESPDLHIDDSRTLLTGPGAVKRLGSEQAARLTGTTEDDTSGGTKAA